MDNVYVVLGESVEYSDRVDWVVAVFSTEEQAMDHARRANEYQAKISAELSAFDSQNREALLSSFFSEDAYIRRDAIRKKQDENPFDRSGKGYDSRSYTVEEVGFYRHVDDYLERA